MCIYEKEQKAGPGLFQKTESCMDILPGLVITEYAVRKGDCILCCSLLAGLGVYGKSVLPAGSTAGFQSLNLKRCISRHHQVFVMCESDFG